MRTPAPPGSCLRFGVFEFNPQTAELRKQGLKVRLWPQAAKILWLLLERPGEIRTREELQRRLWPSNSLVDFERSLNKSIHMLRDALGDSAGNPRYIETFPGEGYRFIPIPQDRRSFAVKSRNMRKIDSVAVLPFVSENPDAELEFLKKRVGERLIDNISRVPGLRVLAYRTVQHFRDKDLVPTRVGRDLLVRAVAVGEILQRNDEVLLHIELIDVGDGTQLWGAQFGGLLVDVIRCPEKLADSVSDQLLPILVPAVSRIKEEPRERTA